jgi:hypothetical protein
MMNAFEAKELATDVVNDRTVRLLLEIVLLNVKVTAQYGDREWAMTHTNPEMVNRIEKELDALGYIVHIQEVLAGGDPQQGMPDEVQYRIRVIW